MLIFLVLLSRVLGIILPSTTKDEFRTLTLKNLMQATVVSCYSCHEAGVSMAVGVGSMHDTIPGIAHFLEHMLFFASKAYPQEDYWTTFVNTHGGSTNAYTNFEETVYYFSVANNALEKGLHIISRAFIEPVFLPETAAREILAVKSELEGRFDDNWRIQKLIEAVIGPPLDHVTIGNIEELSISNITEYLYNFWEQFYKGNNLKLCITGNYTLDTLEQWVQNYFDEIEPGEKTKGVKVPECNRGLGCKNYAVGEKLWEGETSLVLWVLPPESTEYQEIDFISYLLQYTLTESLDETMGGRFYSGKYVDLKDFCIFMLESSQDSQGETDQEKIFGALLGAIDFISTIGNETLYNLWQDYQKLALYSFLYSDPLKSADLASTIASNMLYYPESLYYAGNSIKLEYSYENIQKFLGAMKADQAYFSLLTSDPTLVFTQYDKFFDLKFDVYFASFTPSQLPFIHLDQNPYIPTDLKLVLNKFTESIIQLENSPFGIWFKYNTSLRKPVVYIAALIVPENWAEMKPLAYIHLSILQEEIYNEFKYYSYAGYSVKFEILYNGIELKVSGWNIGIFEYFQQILDKFTKIDSSKFQNLKSRLISHYQYQTIDSYEIAIEYLNRLITTSALTTPELLSLIENSTLSDFLYYEAQLKYSNANLLILGNLNVPSNTSALLEKFFEGGAEIEYKRSLILNDFQVFVAETSNENAILNWYEFGSYDIHTFMLIQLIQVFFKDQVYISLRSKAQLGYTVALGISDNFMSNALYLVVQGATYNPKEMQNYIDEFWNNAEISETEVNDTKSVIKDLLLPPETYQEILDFNWEEITSGRFKFDSREELSLEVDKLIYPEILEILSQIKGHGKELSIRMYVDLNESIEVSVHPDYFRQYTN